MAERLAKEVTRRDVLGLGAIGATIAAVGTAILGMLRLPKPAVFPVPSQSYKVGAPAEFPVGEARVPAGRSVYVLHGPDGYSAVSAVCTHLGCIVKHTGDGFACPCHGSKFDGRGNVTGGPAPRPLEWFELSLAPDGQLMVDEARTVKAGTWFRASGHA